MLTTNKGCSLTRDVNAWECVTPCSTHIQAAPTALSLLGAHTLAARSTQCTLICHAALRSAQHMSWHCLKRASTTACTV